MSRVFELLLLLYPADYREEFGGEMRTVLRELDPRGWYFFVECCGLVGGAVREWRVQVGMVAGGAAFAWLANLLLYWYLVPVAHGQMVRQDPAALEIARSIYSRSFTAIKAAKTLEDLRAVSDEIDAAEWISVDRFGRTVLTKKDADRDLQSILSIDPEHRVRAMDVIWAERDGDRMMVLAWIMPHERDGVTHATLIRDLFDRRPEGWKRVRHDKLTPNDLAVSVNGKAKVLPPMEEEFRVRPK